MLEDTLLRIAVALETIAARPWPAPQAEPEVVKAAPKKSKKAETPPEQPVDTPPAIEAPAGEATEPVPLTPAEASPSEPAPAPDPAPDPAAIKAALTEALNQYVLAHSRDELVALLGKFGAKRMGEVKPSDHPALLAEVEAALV